MKNIILIGLPGCGKTTIGKELAKAKNAEFFDADAVLEETNNIKIPDFFEKFGESAFRDEETKILKMLTQKTGAVISTGGGAVERGENREILRNGGVVVFVNRPVEAIYGDVDISSRPLLKDDKERLFRLRDRRFPKYKDFCHIEIENTTTVSEAVQKILDEVNKQNG